MKFKALFAAIVGIDFILLLLQIQGLSIGYHEARIVYGDTTPLHALLNLSFQFFGQNDYALRFPMIMLHIASVVLLYAITRYYVTRESDRLWIVLIYVLLPGVISSALIVDNAGIMITALFAFAYLYLRFGPYAMATVPLLVWIDAGFVYLFTAFILYGLYSKQKEWIAGGIVALALSLYLHGIDIGGTPESRFLDSLGLYSAVFSPIVFIYLFYVLYRRMIAKEWDLLWIIAMSAFVISLLLSFRQKVDIQSFVPFVLLSLPLAAQTFFRTYRVRLREFRRRYRLLFYGAFGLLVFNALAVFFNQWMYRVLEDPTRHFAYPMHVAKELSWALKEQNVECIDAGDEKLQLRLAFYGITHCTQRHLDNKASFGANKVTISYKDTPVSSFYVSK